MIIHSLASPGWRGNTAALILGALVPYSLAPFDLWPLGIFAAAGLAYLLTELRAKQGFVRSLWFGLGMFGRGASWVFVAIHEFGYTAAPLATVLTGLFVIGLAIVFALPFAAYCRFTPTTVMGRVLVFPAIWVLGEWSRSWFLTGFPWLYLGYAHIDTWLAGWAPVFGVFGLSFIAVLSGLLIGQTLLSLLRYSHDKELRHLPALAFAAATILGLWSCGYFLSLAQWGEKNIGKTISAAMIQPNIPLSIKWNPLYRDEIMTILREQTEPHWDKDLVLWPEAAVPLMYHDALDFLDDIGAQADATNTGLITGILYDDPEEFAFYNSIVGVGRAEGLYFKQRLVPFGEYVPLEAWLRGIIAFFDLPNSIIFPGPKNQEILSFDDYKIASSICYEIVYPDLVARLSRQSDLLVTISNDAWFGKSIGPKQHFQMARMRALENQRFVLRSTNTGVSGIIDPKGKILVLADQFEQSSAFTTNVRLSKSQTLFSRFGSWPIILLCFCVVFCFLIRDLLENAKHSNPNTVNKIQD